MKPLMTATFLLIFLATKAQTSDSSKAKEISTDSIYKNLDVEASFPGGEKAWNEYVMKGIAKKFEKIAKDKASNGTCEVQFVIDTDGSIINVEAITMKNSVLAKFFIEIVRNGEKWQPGLKNGRPAKVYRRQKVTFSVPDF